MRYITFLWAGDNEVGKWHQQADDTIRVIGVGSGYKKEGAKIPVAGGLLAVVEEHEGANKE